MSAPTRFNNITFGHVYNYQQEVDYVTEEGQMEIDNLIHRQYDKCVQGIGDWSWLAKGGRFTVRLSKYCKDEFGIKVAPETLAEVGSLYNKYHVKSELYHFDFTDDLEWEAGEFGDDGSCFWKSKKHHRLMLEHGGAYAVRFYTENSNGERRGYARAWMMELGKPNVVAMFNGYGIETRRLAQIVAEWSGYPEIRQTGDIVFRDPETKATHSGIFINDHSTVFLVGAYQDYDIAELRMPYYEKADYCRVCRKLTALRYRGQFVCENHIQIIEEEHQRRLQELAKREELARQRMEELKQAGKQATGDNVFSYLWGTGSSTSSSSFFTNTTSSTLSWSVTNDNAVYGPPPKFIGADDNQIRYIGLDAYHAAADAIDMFNPINDDEADEEEPEDFFDEFDENEEINNDDNRDIDF